MSKNLIWILGGGSAAAGIAVGGWVLTQVISDQVEPATLRTPDTTQSTDAGSALAPAPTTTGPQPPAVAPDATQPDVMPSAPTVTDRGTGTDTPEQATPVQPPRFDVVRVSRAGDALVAGSALPGAQITLRVDGAMVARSAADGAGQFVAIFALDPSDAAQVMTLEMADAAGVVTTSPDQVVLTHRPAENPAETLAESAPAAPVEPSPDQPLVAEAAEPRPAVPQAPRGQATTDAERPETALAALETQGLPEAPELVPDLAPEPTPENVGAAMGSQTDPTVMPALPAAQAPVPETQAPEQSQSAVPADSATRAQTPPPAQGPESVPELGPALPPAPAQAPAPSVALADSAPQPAAPVAPALPDDTPTAFLVRGSGAVEVLDRQPQVLDNVVIDSISYSASGDVQISGRAANAATGGDLRIYLNNQPIATTAVSQADWTTDLPNVDPGVYTLRVDQLNPTGQVVSRFETPFQREEPAAVAAASAQIAALSEPSDPQPAPASGSSAAPSAPAAAANLITVQPGHTLWAISQDRYGAGDLYVLIYRANRSQIRNPDLIYPGQIFALPDN